MEIYVISQAVADRMHTPALLKAAGIRFTLVVDNEEQARTARKLGYTRVAATPEAKGIVAKRNAITAMQSKGWYIGLDDNIQQFTAVRPGYRSTDILDTTSTGLTPWRKIFNEECEPGEYITLLGILANLAKQNGTVYGGVATMENPFFRGGRRYAYRRFVKTKAFVFNASCGLQFKHSMCHDSYMTAQVLANYGRVVVDQRMFYTAKWYERGGLGSREAREAAGLMEQLQACCEEFPGLVKIGKGKNTALRVCKVNDTSIELWRQANGYRKGNTG